MLQWAKLLVLILLSAFFSAAETALTTFNKIKMREKADSGSRAAAILLKMTEQKPKMLSAILIGNNIVNIAASAIATTIAMSIGFNVGVMTLILTLVILIFGEITPKNAAAVKAEHLALFYARVIYALMILLTPVIWTVNLICSGVLKLFGIDMQDSQTIMTEGELRTIVDVSHEDGVIETEEKQMIKKYLFGFVVTLQRNSIPNTLTTFYNDENFLFEADDGRDYMCRYIYRYGAASRSRLRAPS